MRIAVLTSLFPSSVRPFEGIFAERRWAKMRARGHEVTVTQPLPRAPFSFGRREWAEIARMPAREERCGVPVARPRYTHVPKRARGNARAFAACGVKHILAGGRPDVVVADYAWPAAMAAEALAEAGCALVVSGRGSDVLQVAGEAGLGEELAACLRSAGHWCAVSRDLLEVMDRLGGRSGRGVLVPNGVELDVFGLGERAAERERLGLPQDAVVVVVVGHLIERKDPLLAVRVWTRLAESLGRPARLVVIGDGPLAGALEAEVAATGRADQVVRVPSVEPAALARWYAACDALLLTSRREGRPNVVLEALACGRPVLATPAGGTGELLEGLEGMLATTRDEGQLAAQLARLIEAGHEPRDLRRHAGGFTWDVGLDLLEQCLQSAALERGAK